MNYKKAYEMERKINLILNQVDPNYYFLRINARKLIEQNYPLKNISAILREKYTRRSK